MKYVPCYAVLLGLCFLPMIYCKCKKNATLSFLFKCCCSSVLLVFALSALSIQKSSVIYLMIVGVAFGAIGDVLLGLRNLALTDNKQESANKLLISGLVSFLIGHLLYIVMTAQLFNFGVFNLAFAIFFAVVSADFIGKLERSKYLKVSYGDMKPHVILYSIVLAFLLFFTLSFLPVNGESALLIHMCGSYVLFLLSDLLLVKLYFNIESNIEKKLTVIDCFNLLLYYLAQFGILMIPLLHAE